MRTNRLVLGVAVATLLGALPSLAAVSPAPAYDATWRPWTRLLDTNPYDVPEAAGRLRGVAPTSRCGDGAVDLATALGRLGAALHVDGTLAPDVRLPAETARYVARLADCLATHIPHLPHFDGALAAPSDALRSEWLGTVTDLLALVEHPPALPAWNAPATCLLVVSCLVQVGSSGSDTYTEDAVLIVDPDGSDTYSNNAAGAYPLAPPAAPPAGPAGLPAALVLDLGSATDFYVPVLTDSNHPTNGAGRFGGVGVLVDQGGDDTYCGLGTTMGTGVSGAGLLLDLAGGDTYESWDPDSDDTDCPWTAADPLDPNRYHRHKTDHGAGLFGGFGFLIDGGGGDTYVNYGVDSLGYGAGGGTGLLLDAGTATDKYEVYGALTGCGIGSCTPQDHSGVSIGTGEVSGVGVLLDAGGDDEYGCYDVLTYGCIGATSGGLLGLLYDAGGNDKYTLAPLQNSGRAAGIGAAEAFIDATQVPEVTGAAIFADQAGDDTYTASNSSAVGWGRAHNAVPSLGLFLDLGGTDTYSAVLPGRGNGLHWTAGTAGVGKDL